MNNNSKKYTNLIELLKSAIKNTKEFKMIKNRNEKGITLIALVVTIIVLLILAGIAISLTIGNNGLFSRAKNAADIWNKASENEIQKINDAENILDDELEKLGLKDKPKGTDLKYFEITYDETNKTAKITAIKDEYMKKGYYTWGTPIAIPIAIIDGETTITDIVIPEEVIKDGEAYKIVDIGTTFGNPIMASNADYIDHMSEITSIVLPNTITVLQPFAFWRCTSLKSVTLPNTMTSIGEYAFSNCERLESVDLSKTLIKEINNYTFAACNSLKNVTLPQGLKEIGELSFNYCSNLESIKIPKSVKTIIDTVNPNLGHPIYPFTGCTNLTITLEKDSPFVEEIERMEETGAIKEFHKWGAKEVIVEQ